MTVRIPRTGQIRLSAHISASFNNNSGSQTSMGNSGVTAACHNTMTWSPTQRSMNTAHGVITALTLNDRYANTNYGTGSASWAANTYTYTNSAIYNKLDVRADGAIYNKADYRAPSVEAYGTHGHTMNMSMYGDSPGAIYANQYKKLNKLSQRETVPFRLEMATGQGQEGWGCRAQAYLYGYTDGYVLGQRSDNISLQGIYVGSSNWSTSWTQANSPTASSGLYVAGYQHLVVGYRGFTQYPGYNSRRGRLEVRPYYMRLIATSGYA